METGRGRKRDRQRLKETERRGGREGEKAAPFPEENLFVLAAGVPLHCLLPCSRDASFPDEDQMRVRGYDKTPDFKLEVPIGK